MPSRVLERVAQTLTAACLSTALIASAHAGPFGFDLVARQFDTIDGQQLDFFRGVALDDQGRVAYTAVAIDDDTQQSTGAALLLDNRLVVATDDVIENGTLGFLGEPSLASNAAIAYSADVFQTGEALNSTGVVVGDPSDSAAHRLVVGRDTLIGGVPLDGAINPSLNAAGSFAYTGIYFDSVLNLNAAAILFNDQVIAATGDTVGNYVVDTVDHASLNDQGDLAFQASLIDLTTGQPASAVFLNGQLMAIGGPLPEAFELLEVFKPSVNRHGQLAYIARYLDSGTNLENTAVVFDGQIALASGDTNADGLIIDLIEDISINASGQIAIHATFIDSATNTFFEEGIFLTRVIPEAGSFVILALGGLLMATRRRA